ncbi:hypothetical protein HUJ05_005706 [Dendroctonus ponderosae]|nr:hypothetical protein HUJ05_005706 [Dendroctonus ponderosae]
MLKSSSSSVSNWAHLLILSKTTKACHSEHRSSRSRFNAGRAWRNWPKLLANNWQSPNPKDSSLQDFGICTTSVLVRQHLYQLGGTITHFQHLQLSVPSKKLPQIVLKCDGNLVNGVEKSTGTRLGSLLLQLAVNQFQGDNAAVFISVHHFGETDFATVQLDGAPEPPIAHQIMPQLANLPTSHQRKCVQQLKHKRESVVGETLLLGEFLAEIIAVLITKHHREMLMYMLDALMCALKLNCEL